MTTLDKFLLAWPLQMHIWPRENLTHFFYSFFLQILEIAAHFTLFPGIRGCSAGVNIYVYSFLCSQMSWRPTYRGSKFRNVYGKVANREQSFEGIPITKNVHDNHFCAVNSKFVAVVTESAGGGSFIVIPVSQVTRSVMALFAVVWVFFWGGG